MSEVILSVTGLEKSYDEVIAVAGLDFEIAKGECFGLLGPNGAGKSTTLAMLEGMEDPTQGTVQYYGGPRPPDYQTRVGIQFQATALQDFLTPFDNLKLFSSFYDDPIPMDHLIDQFRLQEFLHRDSRRLSGGQRQRLLLALALVHNPEIVFLDEPTTGLHSHDIKKLLEILQAFANTGNTVVVIEHNLDVIKTADHIIDMGPEGGINGGKIIAEGTPEKVSTFKESYTGKFIKEIMGENNMKKTA